MSEDVLKLLILISGIVFETLMIMVLKKTWIRNHNSFIELIVFILSLNAHITFSVRRQQQVSIKYVAYCWIFTLSPFIFICFRKIIMLIISHNTRKFFYYAYEKIEITKWNCFWAHNLTVVQCVYCTTIDSALCSNAKCGSNNIRGIGVQCTHTVPRYPKPRAKSKT